MTPKPKTKETNTESVQPGVSQAELDSLYQSLAKQQQLLNSKSNDWTPNAMPLSNRQTPIIPMQVTGSLSYDNTPNTYVAPSYGQFKDLSIKKDNEARLNKTAWDKAKEILYNLPIDINDPSYQQIKQLMGKSIDEYDAKLKEGMWSDNADLSKQFANDLYNNKGGKLFSEIRQAMAAKEEELKELASNFDEKTQTGGVRPDAIAYYKTPKFKEVQIIDDKVYGGGVYYPPVFTTRNMFKEVDDMLKDTKFFQTSSDGKGNIKLIPTGMLGKYLREEDKYVDEKRARAIAESYIRSNGGEDYLRNEAAIENFKSPFSLKEGKAYLQDLANQTDKLNKENKDSNGNNPYRDILSQSDDKIAQDLQGKVGEQLQYYGLRNSLLSGTVLKNAYHQLSYDEINDTDVQDQAKAARAATAKEMEEKEAEASYMFDVVNVGTEQIKNEYNPNWILTERSNLDNQIKAADNEIKRLQALNPGKDLSSLPSYQQALERRSDLEGALKQLNQTTAQTNQFFGDIVKQKTKIGYSTLYDIFASTNNKVSKKVFVNAMNNAVSLYAQGREKEANAVLTNNGIPTSIQTTMNLSDFAKKTKDGLLKEDMVVARDNNIVYPITGGKYNLDLSRVLKLGAQQLATLQKQGKYKNIQETVSMGTDVFRLTPDVSEKYTEAKLYQQKQKEITDVANLNMSGITVWNPSGNPKNNATIYSYLAKQYGVDIEDLDRAGVIFNDVNLSTLTNYDGGRNKGGVFVGYLGYKPISKESDKEGYEAQQRVKEKLKGDVKLRFTYGANNKNISDGMQSLIKAMYDKQYKYGGIGTEETRNKMALSYGNLSGINKSFDVLRVYELDPSGRDNANKYRDVNWQGYDFRISAFNSPYTKGYDDKQFTMQVKDSDGKYKYVAKDKNGNDVFLTDDEIRNRKDVTKMEFDTDLDLKAYFNRVLLDKEQNVNFNKGVGGNYMEKVRGAESSGNDRAKNPDSSATGRYQFTNDTWARAKKALNMPHLDRNNPNHQNIAMQWLTKENSNFLSKKGVTPNNQNLYMVHFLGQGSADRFFDALKNNPNAPASSIATGKQYSANRSVFDKAKTVRGLYELMSKKVM